MKATADVVTHSSQRHGPQRDEHHVARFGRTGSRVFTQQEQELARARELRRLAKAAAAAIEGDREFLDRSIEDRSRWNRSVAALRSQSAETLSACRRRRLD